MFWTKTQRNWGMLRFRPRNSYVAVLKIFADVCENTHTAEKILSGCAEYTLRQICYPVIMMFHETMFRS